MVLEKVNTKMPELPEVETIKLGLQKKIVGLTIKNIQILSPKSAQFKPNQVEGKKVIGVWRRAKMLGIDLGGDESIVFHLKMTGQLIFDDGKRRIIGGHPTPDMRDTMPTKATRVIFELSDGAKLYFNDQRRFGWIKLVHSSEFMVHGEGIFGKLGPEPLEKEFSWQILKEKILRHKKTPIKLVIMDQSVVSGIGNIYANEALFLAGIDPKRKVSTLSDEEIKKLHDGIIKSLKISLEHGGSTLAHFVDSEGKKGYFLDFAYVYGKTGQKCKGCKGIVEKFTLGGRGTYWCPECQR